MRRLAALALVVILIVAIAQPADACGAACGVAIGLASFFFLSALVAPFAYPYPGYPAYAYAAPVVYQPPVVYSTPVVYRAPAAQSPAVYHASAPAQVRVVQYPHGRYELHGDGVTTPYQWVWVAAAEPIPAPSAGLPPGSPPPTATQ